MKVRTRPVEMEAHQVKSLCAWYQKRQLQGMPEPIVKAHKAGQLQFRGDQILLVLVDGRTVADWEDMIVVHPRGQLERMPVHVFESRFEIVRSA